VINAEPTYAKRRNAATPAADAMTTGKASARPWAARPKRVGVPTIISNGITHPTAARRLDKEKNSYSS